MKSKQYGNRIKTIPQVEALIETNGIPNVLVENLNVDTLKFLGKNALLISLLEDGKHLNKPVIYKDWSTKINTYFECEIQGDNIILYYQKVSINDSFNNSFSVEKIAKSDFLKTYIEYINFEKIGMKELQIYWKKHEKIICPLNFLDETNKILHVIDQQEMNAYVQS